MEMLDTFTERRCFFFGASPPKSTRTSFIRHFYLISSIFLQVALFLAKLYSVLCREKTWSRDPYPHSPTAFVEVHVKRRCLCLVQVVLVEFAEYISRVVYVIIHHRFVPTVLGNFYKEPANVKWQNNERKMAWFHLDRYPKTHYFNVNVPHFTNPDLASVV